MSVQALLVRWITPPVTLTMVEQALATVGTEEGFRWVDYRPIPADAQGRHAPRMAVASEDGWFWHHGGFDLGQMSYAIRDVLRGRDWRGASTISQQVARNVFLWQGRNTLTRAVRKALEVPYTILLELFVPKERILELYLNIAEMGPLTFGIEAAAQRHFDKPAAELSPSEAARIIAILPAPRVWSVRGTEANERLPDILANRVPFPDDDGFEQMSDNAWDKVGWGSAF